MNASTVAARDGWMCWLCEGPVDPDAPVGSAGHGTVDHVVPRSRGGSNDPANLRLAHRRCNMARANHLPELAWPVSLAPLDASGLWQSIARCVARPGAGEIVALFPHDELAAMASVWAVERAEELVPGGWICSVEVIGPVWAVRLVRPDAAPLGSAGRPKVTDPRRSKMGRPRRR